MRYIITVGLAMILIASCMPALKGDSVKAKWNRDQMASTLLDKVSPDGCAYAPFGEMYGWCKDPESVESINKRVETVKKEIVEYLYRNPGLSNTYIFFEIIINDLYFCRNEKGNGLVIGENKIYCETELPTELKKRFNDNDLKYMGEKEGKYSYSIRWDHKKRWQEYIADPFLHQ